MKYFYWTMAVLTLGTFVPSALFMLLFVLTGENVCLRRSRTLFQFAKVFGLVGVNVGIWGHVVVALWKLWF
jgi:hypothetical protein